MREFRAPRRHSQRKGVPAARARREELKVRTPASEGPCTPVEKTSKNTPCCYLALCSVGKPYILSMLSMLSMPDAMRDFYFMKEQGHDYHWFT